MKKGAELDEDGLDPVGCAHNDPAEVPWIKKDDIWDRQFCEEIWHKITQAIKWKSSFPATFKVDDIHRVMVGEKYCYKPSLYQEKGWCRLADAKDKWGFCSASCRMDFIRVNSVPHTTK